MITPLSPSTKSLIISAQHYESFESTITSTLSHLHPVSTSTRIIIHPQALRYKILINTPEPPPTAFLTQLSTISSLELTTPQHRTHLRGGETLNTANGDHGIHGVILEVWELFYSIPVRRRLEISRDEDEVISATREMVTRLALTYPGRGLCLSTWSNQEIYAFSGSITQDALQMAFGLGVTWLRVYKTSQHTTIDGYIAKEGTTNGRYQLCTASTMHEHRVCESFNQVWRSLPKEGRKRCAAFVVSVEGPVLVDFIKAAIKDVLGVREDDRKQQRITMPSMKKRVSSQRFEETIIKRPRSEQRPCRNRLSIMVNKKKRPASAVEDAYRRMIPSWKNPCLPSRGRGVLPGLYDKRSVCITKERIATVRIVGQVDDKFILIADEYGVYAVDQHAASERYLYERLLKRCLKERRSHKLANPRMVNIPTALRQVAKKVLTEAVKWGWKVEDGFIVTHVPELLPVGVVVEADGLVEWFEDCFVGGKQIPSLVTRLVASAACHAAVRFGDKLDKDMCQSIVTSLAECDMPFVCAHGRPNVVPIVAFDKT